MRQLYLFWLSALALLGVSFNTQAQEYSINLEWDEPGSILIYSSGTGDTNKIALENNQVSAIVTPLNTNYMCYVKASDGYQLVSCTANDGKVISLNSSYAGQQFMINMKDNNGKTFKIVVEKIVYDAILKVNVINGAKQIAANFEGTNRALTFKTGHQEIPFSSKFEGTIKTIEYTGTRVNPYLKKDGVELPQPTNKYFYRFSNIAIENGTELEMKVSETPDVVEENVKITVKNDDNSNKAFVWVRDITDNKAITLSADGTADFISGHKVRATFDNTDYNVTGTINGEAWPEADINTNGQYLNFEATITAETTLAFTATERTYGNTDLYVAIHGDLNGVILTEGGYDGKVIDLSTLTSTEVTKDGDTYSLYTIPVSLKSPKIFWTSTEGYWIHEQKTVASDGEGGYAEAGSVSSNNCSKSQPAYIYVHKIDKNKKAVIYVKGVLSGFALKDARGNGYTLTEGYNDIEFDPIYSGTFSIRPYLQSESDKFSAYRNYVALSPDDNNVYNTTLSDGDVLHIFPIEAAPAQYTISVTRDDRSSVITHDKVLKVDPTAKSFKVFAGTEITVTPRTDSKFLLDGEATTSNTFIVSKAHNITLSYEGNLTEAVTDPADGTDAESLEFVTVTFPNATSVVRSALADDEMMFVAMGNSWAPASITIEAIENAEKPSFKISFTPAPTEMKQYILDIPAGFFIVDNDLDSKQITSTLTLKKNLTEMAYAIDPVGDTMPVAEWGPIFTVIFDDGIQIPALDDETIAEKVTIKFNDEKIEYDPTFTGGFFMTSEANNLMAQVLGAANKEGTLSIEIAAGLFKVGDLESPAISKTYQIIAAKEYSYTVTTPTESDSRHSSLAEIIITFPEAEEIAIWEYAFADLKNDANSPNPYIQRGTMEIVSDTPATRAATGKSVKITFNPAPTANGEYKLYINDGAFILDNVYPSSIIEHPLVLDSTVGVIEIGSTNLQNAIVISIDGKVLSAKADKAFIDNLDKGIYIINGKKYIKK